MTTTQAPKLQLAVLPQSHWEESRDWASIGCTTPFGGCDRATGIARDYVAGYGRAFSVYMRSVDDVNGRLWIVAPAGLESRAIVEELYGPVLWITTERAA